MTKLRSLLAASVAAVISCAALPTIASAEVNVLGWPGGSEETALRAAVEAYNALPGTAADDKVSLLFFNRDGFYDKLQADMAAGSDAFDIKVIATYSIGRYAPYMCPRHPCRRRCAVAIPPATAHEQHEALFRLG